jgi:predicted AlkP superfamily pyrophosphatase or phosphodiesterase
VREVWEELKKSFPGKATLIVASDHGFFSYQQQIQPNVLLRNEGLLTAEGTKITGGSVRALGQGGAAFIYVLDPANREAAIEKLATKFKEVEGVDLVIGPKDFPKYGLADPQKNPQMADLVLSAKEGYSFSDSLAGNLVVTPKSDVVKGTHGYDPNQPRLHGTFVAWGAGIKAGAKPGTMSNTDVAPTMAELLGVKIPGADGRVLDSILSK